MLGWLRRWFRREEASDLPEAQRLVRDIQRRHGDLPWPRLVEEAAGVGIGEAELHEIVYGKPLAPGAYGPLAFRR